MHIELNFRLEDAWNIKADVLIVGHKSPTLVKAKKTSLTRPYRLKWDPNFMEDGTNLCECDILSSRKEKLPWQHVISVKHSTRKKPQTRTADRLGGILMGMHTLIRPQTVLFTSLSCRNPESDTLALIGGILTYHMTQGCPNLLEPPLKEFRYVICDKETLEPFRKIAKNDFEQVRAWYDNKIDIGIFPTPKKSKVNFSVTGL